MTWLLTSLVITVLDVMVRYCKELAPWPGAADTWRQPREPLFPARIFIVHNSRDLNERPLDTPPRRKKGNYGWEKRNIFTQFHTNKYHLTMQAGFLKPDPSANLHYTPISRPLIRHLHGGLRLVGGSWGKCIFVCVQDYSPASLWNQRWRLVGWFKRPC